MANIATELTTISEGRYGKDVRKAIHDGLQKVNTDVDSKAAKSSPTTSGTFTHTGNATISGSVASASLSYKDGNNTVDVKSAIDAITSRPSEIELTSASPLNGCSASSIVGIDVDGCSTQGIATISSVVGTINGANGQPINQSAVSNVNRCISNVFGASSGGSINISSGCMLNVYHATSESGNIDRSSGWVSAPYSITENGYYRVLVRYGDGTTAITPSQFTLTASNVTPTPTNPIAIVDASGDVIAIGKNLFDKSNVVNGYLDGNGNVVSNTQFRVSDYIDLVGSSITISGNKGANEIICFFAEDKTRVSHYAMGSNTTKTLDIPTNAKYVRCTISSDYLNTYQVELGTTATDYVPYKSNTITLPYTLRSVGTVKDELIVNADGSGKIVRRVGTVDLSTFEYTYTSNWNGFHIFNTNSLANVAKLPSSLDVIANILCSRFKATSRNVMASASYAFEGEMAFHTNGAFMLGTNAYSSVDSFKTAMSGVLLYYELATPTTETLTSEQVASIRQLQTYSGTTIIDSELDVKSVTYHAGVKEYIDWRFEQLEALMIGEV